jgi:hypothetical protein
MSNANDYVNHFYDKYHGRVAIGVGYNHDLSEIYPLVFQNTDGESIGLVALGAISDAVYIYHLGAFITRHGDGSKILKELCHQADRFNIDLTVSAVHTPNGGDPTMNSRQLKQWYESFGFMGESRLLREPKSARP